MITECILVTVNTSEVRSALRDYPGIELVSSQDSFIVWHWITPSGEDLAVVGSIEGYKGTVQIV